MREERTIRLAEVPIGGNAGFMWNRLHEEREGLCQKLLRGDAENRKLLQKRLRSVDDALDRLMSGSALPPRSSGIRGS